MGTPYAAFITLVVTSGVFNVLMGIYVLFGRTNFAGKRVFFAINLLSAVYIFGAALELGAGSLEEIKFWIQIEYIGMPYLPPLELVLVLIYLGFEKQIRRPFVIALLLVPAATMLLMWTNDAHHFFYRSLELRDDTPMLRVNAAGGPWYTIYGAYNCACMMGAVILLLRGWSRLKAYRRQLFSMLIGVLLPLVGDFAYLFGMTPEGIDPIPVLMSVTSAMYLWALTSTGLFNVVPIARDKLFESMNDGVLVCDLELRLVDYNSAAAALMPELTSVAIGHRLEAVWALHTDEPLRLSDDQARFSHGGIGGETQDVREIGWRVGEQEDYYLVRRSFIRTRRGQAAGMLLVMTTITERRRLQEELKELAYYDGLTKIYNRLQFFRLSKALLAETNRSGEPLSIVLFDIDYFKRINDEHGHETGDRALQHIVQLSRRVLRTEDVFARYGGEEFVVAMPGLTLEQAGQAALRIRRELAGHPLAGPRGELAITASFGVAQAMSAADTVEQLLRQADHALYRSKHSGRNTVHLIAEGVEARELAG
ncbi:MAG: diguanylate cyclase [Paenibacillaceae bacterium]|nr:diguanylate cyclase [Paenibacillaceae bacterium]